MRCQKCGKENQWDTVFCKSCGARMDLSRAYGWSLLGFGWKVACIASIVAYALFGILWLVGDAIHVPGGGLLQPAYTFWNLAWVAIIVGTPLLISTRVVITRRRMKLVSLHAEADAKLGKAGGEPVPSPDAGIVPREAHSIAGADPVRKRAEYELKAYKRTWLGLLAATLVSPLLLLMLPLSEGVRTLGNLDVNSGSVLLLAYAFAIAVFMIFSRYPSDEKISDKISKWRANPAEVAPAFLTGQEAGPHNILLSLLAGGFAVWLSGFFPFFALAFYLIFADELSLFFYCYPLILISVVGLVVQRRRATRAVESALRKQTYHLGVP